MRWLASRYATVVPLVLWAAAPAPRAAAAGEGARALDVGPLRSLPVLDGGRVKPFDTLARETARAVTGRESFGAVEESIDGEQALPAPLDPVALMLAWADRPGEWERRAVLYVPLIELRQRLGMQPGRKWVSPESVRGHRDFRAWVEETEAKQAAAEKAGEEIKLTRPEEAAVELKQRLEAFDSAAELRLYHVVPAGLQGAGWDSLATLLGRSGTEGPVSPGPAPAGPGAPAVRAGWAGVMEAFRDSDSAAFARAVETFRAALRQAGAVGDADSARASREVGYNTLKPFRVAWALYFVALAALVVSAMLRRRLASVTAFVLFALAIAFHAAAFVWRCSITGWAPVTNMYETLIWVALMTSVFAAALALVYRRTVIAVGGAAAAVAATVVADAMPPEYGSAIHTLAPVLRSNYWLTIHVLTIVSSYAAFALALVLGNLVLGQYVLRGRRSAPYPPDRCGPRSAARPDPVQTHLLYTYRAVQVGVLLVAAGTILGALWADVSWGRFWGWDPKEVWALIVLLTYLALLHGRFAGWIGPFGLAAGAVLCFTAVLMSWYGVNFVLGVGLHAYGFGAGGQGYVAAYVLAQWAFVGWARRGYRRSLRGRGQENSADRAPRETRGGPGGTLSPSVVESI